MKKLTLKERKAKRNNLIGMILIGLCSSVFLTIIFGCLYASANLTRYV